MPIPFLVSVFVFMLTPFLMGTTNLSAAETAQVLEYYTVFPGIILLVPIFLPEQNKDIHDMIYSKYTNPTVIYGVRLIMALLVMMGCLWSFMMMLNGGNCDFPFVTYYFGTLAGMIFLGGIGMLGYAVSNNPVIGYMVPMIYYIVNIAGGKKYLGNFYLFSMMQGEFIEKWYLFGSGVLCMAAGIFLWIRKER